MPRQGRLLTRRRGGPAVGAAGVGAGLATRRDMDIFLPSGRPDAARAGPAFSFSSRWAGVRARSAGVSAGRNSLFFNIWPAGSEARGCVCRPKLSLSYRSGAAVSALVRQSVQTIVWSLPHRGRRERQDRCRVGATSDNTDYVHSDDQVWLGMAAYDSLDQVWLGVTVPNRHRDVPCVRAETTTGPAVSASASRPARVSGNGAAMPMPTTGPALVASSGPAVHRCRQGHSARSVAVGRPSATRRGAVTLLCEGCEGLKAKSG